MKGIQIENVGVSQTKQKKENNINMFVLIQFQCMHLHYMMDDKLS